MRKKSNRKNKAKSIAAAAAAGELIKVTNSANRKDRETNKSVITVQDETELAIKYVLDKGLNESKNAVDSAMDNS